MNLQRRGNPFSVSEMPVKRKTVYDPHHIRKKGFIIRYKFRNPSFCLFRRQKWFFHLLFSEIFLQCTISLRLYRPSKAFLLGKSSFRK